MMPDYYEYYNSVKIISGKRTLEQLPEELAMMGAKRPIIVTDKGVVNAGLIKIVEDGVAASDVEIGAVYDDTPVDSSNSVVNEIAGIYREKGCDAIIAVGGGSAIDTAKGVNIVISEGTDDLLKYSGYNRLKAPPKPFVVIPTTGGTGSEVTMAAVIANPDKNVKMLFVSPLLLPRLGLLDARMTLTMPPKITAATGMDALTHSVEAYMCLQKNPLSDAFSFAAIELIRDNLVRAVKDGGDEAARLAMANAAMLAGAAFSNSMVGVIHSLAHALGGVCHVPHGVANAIILPFGMEFNLKKAGDFLADLLLPLAGPEAYAKTHPSSRAEAAIAAVRTLAAELHTLCGLPVKLAQTGVSRDQLAVVAQAAINDGAVNYNPEAVGYEDALAILNKAF